MSSEHINQTSKTEDENKRVLINIEDEDGIHREWLKGGKPYRPDGPAVEIVLPHGGSWVQYFMHPDYPGERYRPDGPADIRSFPNGQPHFVEYYMDPKRPGVKYRPDGPAFIGYTYEGQVDFEEYHMHPVKSGRYREDGPAYIGYDTENGTIASVLYYMHPDEPGASYRPDGPARIYYYPNGQIKEERYCTHPEKPGEEYRSDGPAIIRYYPDGQIQQEQYFTHPDEPGKLYRAGEPAIISYRESGEIWSIKYFEKPGRYGEPFRLDGGPPCIWRMANQKNHVLYAWLVSRIGHDVTYRVGQYAEVREGDTVYTPFVFYVYDEAGRLIREIYIEAEEKYDRSRPESYPNYGDDAERWYLRRRDGGPTEILYDGQGNVIEKRYDVEEIILQSGGQRQ